MCWTRCVQQWLGWNRNSDPFNERRAAIASWMNNNSLGPDFERDIMDHDTGHEFTDLCTALQRNDPTVLKVVHGQFSRTTHFTFCGCPFQCGYGRPLGLALRGNTTVTELDLDICHVVGERIQELHPLRSYLRSNTSGLQRLRLTGSQMWLTHNVVDAVCTAITLRHLEIEASAMPLLRSFHNFMATTTSLVSIKLDLTHHYPMGFFLAVRNAFGANTSLETIDLTAGSEHMLPVVEQLNSHPKVSAFILGLFSRGEYSKTLQIVQTSNVLTHLVLHDNVDYPQWKSMQEALHCSPALTELSMYYCRFDSEVSQTFADNF
jgi:hypothetical protein